MWLSPRKSTKKIKKIYLDLVAKYWVSQLCDQRNQQMLAVKAGLGVLLTPCLEAKVNQLFTLEETQVSLGGLTEITDSDRKRLGAAYEIRGLALSRTPIGQVVLEYCS